MNSPTRKTCPALIAFAIVLSAVAAHAAVPSDPVSAPNDVTSIDLSLPTPPVKLVGSFTGVSGDALIVAGGQSAAGAPVNAAYILVSDKPGAAPDWHVATLAEKLAWGTSVTAEDSLLCLGGVGPDGCQKSVIRLQWQNGKLIEQRLPDLPVPRAWAGSGLLGNVVYLVGGVATPHDAIASNELFSLDLSDPNPHWRSEPSLPGAGRVQPAVIGHYYGLEIFGGRIAGSAPNPARKFNTTSEAWVFRPKPLDFTIKQGWIKLADLPLPLAAGATIATGQAHTLLVGADMQPVIDDWATAWKTAQVDHSILAYHAVTDTWCTLGTYSGDAGATAVNWQGRDILIAPGSGVVQQLSIHSVVRRLHLIDYIILVGYVMLVTGIGLTFLKKQKTTVEFALGGRHTPWWVAALSIYATATSSISLMAVPALTYATNLVWLFQPLISIIVLIPQAYLVIPLIRRLNLTSTYEYLEKRFNPALRLLASFQCIVLYTVGRAAVVILIPAISIWAVTGINVYVAILGVGLLTTIYTSLGGIDAVMWTDVLQALVMLLGPLITIGIIIYSLKGDFSAIHHIGAQYGKFDLAIWSWTPTQPVAWIMIFTVMLTLTGFAGDQAQVQRVLATPNDKVARQATIGNWVICSIGAAIVQMMGVLLFIYFHTHPAQLNPTMKNDQVVPLFAVQVLPAGVAGLIIAGICAASMSCLSGTINSAATLIVQDFYLRWHPKSSDRQRLRLMKFFSYVVGIIATSVATWLAGMQMRSLMETWTTIWSLCGVGIMGVYTLGIFSRRATGAGALIGAATSIVVTILIKRYTPFHWTLYTPLAMFTCIVVGYVASLITPAPRRNLSGLTAFTLKDNASPVAPQARLAPAV